MSCQEVSPNDKVTCKLCSFVGKTLSKHLSQMHGISKDTYLLQFPEAPITSSSSQDAFKKRGQNFAWLKRAKQHGDDLTAYKEKMGKAVSVAIMSNPEERQRRSEQMAKNNKTPEACERSKNVAKQTSARPEIQAVRAERLANWRKMHFDDFYEKCTKAAHSTWHSVPELALFQVLSGVKGYNFKHNQVVKSDNFTNKSHRKQVDAADKDLRVYVEFDGIIHFEERIKGAALLASVRQMDRLLDEHVTRHGWTLIRISYDQFSYKEGGKFGDECLRALFELLKNPIPGVHRIGKAYEISYV